MLIPCICITTFLVFLVLILMMNVSDLTELLLMFFVDWSSLSLNSWSLIVKMTAATASNDKLEDNTEYPDGNNEEVEDILMAKLTMEELKTAFRLFDENCEGFIRVDRFRVLVTRKLKQLKQFISVNIERNWWRDIRRRTWWNYYGGERKLWHKN